ncbi:hypothetical protein DM02DRAFT_631886 [Periconia macrospinosa]|uniref:Uncharacterized protein n=1 Tax=Periconia macrospinosa TaxID=97972 RepID=A0A2V1DEV4_9PLEO|nr:hypothetical protein DM02DRAFT_631886 [Periconia macrospinosa]
MERIDAQDAGLFGTLSSVVAVRRRRRGVFHPDMRWSAQANGPPSNRDWGDKKRQEQKKKGASQTGWFIFHCRLVWIGNGKGKLLRRPPIISISCPQKNNSPGYVREVTLRSDDTPLTSTLLRARFVAGAASHGCWGDGPLVCNFPAAELWSCGASALQG